MDSKLSPQPSPGAPSNTRSPPPLPPRTKSEDSAPPPYSAEDERGRMKLSDQWRSRDPRSSSTQSLRPPDNPHDRRRTLLLIYIHGFMGNEMSFQSFPAHVHNLLSISVSKTHVLHTKIYPRYKSRKAIEFARDDFSEWLEPNETPSTDVVLLGHSMGGILAAEVALLPPRSPTPGQPFRHRILGTIGFDTPYLGMHPGVIVSGIGSLFRPAAKPPVFNPNSQGDAIHSGQISPLSPSQSSVFMPSEPSLSSNSSEALPNPLSPVPSITSSMSTIPSNDPYFDPPFPNDKRIPERTGWNSVLHFINKHSDGLTNATKQYFMSHLEFGGCLADYPALKNRYNRIRELEDVDEISIHDVSGNTPSTRRVRFVNYWTASTGIPKESKVQSGQTVDVDGQLKATEVEMNDMGLAGSSSRSTTPTPRISVEEYNENGVTKREVGEEAGPASTIGAQVQNLGESSGVHEEESGMPLEMRHIDSMPIDDDEELPTARPTTAESASSSLHGDTLKARKNSEPALPPIPPVPEEPPQVDLSVYTDKDSRKIAEKEQKRVQRAYQQAVKDRDNALKDRQKLLEKREKKVRQEQEKQLKAEQKQRAKEEKMEEKRQTAAANPAPPAQLQQKAAAEKAKRDKKFCMLPSKVNGVRDRCWVRVYMEGVDEVGAHCGLFFAGPQYESLVGNVGARVEEWIREDGVRREVLEPSWE